MNHTRSKNMQEQNSGVSATSEQFSTDPEILSVQLKNGDITLELTNIGAAIISLYTPDRTQLQKNIVAGFSNLSDYRTNPDYYGVVVGRYANRIAKGNFSLNGKQYQLSVNNGKNHLHGGRQGFGHKLWSLVELNEGDDQCFAVFAYLSKDGEEGYPGNLEVKVKYTLDNAGRITIDYFAATDHSTPVNLTNHSYFNLTGFENPSVLDHALVINAGFYTEKNDNNTPTGKILPVENTGLDFRVARILRDGIDSFPGDLGYDHNFVLETSATGELKEAARLYESSTGRTLTVYTTMPGMQLYTANYWDGKFMGRQGKVYQKHGAVALETQSFPDSVNHPNFPCTILQPGEQYHTTTIFEFGISKD